MGTKKSSDNQSGKTTTERPAGDPGQPKNQPVRPASQPTPDQGQPLESEEDAGHFMGEGDNIPTGN